MNKQGEKADQGIERREDKNSMEKIESRKRHRKEQTEQITDFEILDRRSRIVPQTRFGSYFEKGKIFPFGKESIFPFRKNHPLLEDTKFRLSLCMSLVFCASRNVSFNDDNYILKFSAKFSLIPKICYQVLSSARGCLYTSRS